MDSAGQQAPTAVEQEIYLFRKRLPLKVKLHEALAFLGDTAGRTCLDVGACNAVMSYHLRKHGGEWHSIPADPGHADIVAALVGGNVHKFEDGKLPFDNKVFDAVVVFDFLERVRDDAGFVAECHRVMKPDGALLITTARVKKFDPIRSIGELLGVSYTARGMIRPGYSESRLFTVLKNGFDVYNVRNFSRFFTELTDVIVRAIVARRTRRGRDNTGSGRLYSVAGFFYHVAAQLDVLLLLTKGYQQVAKAKRRAWRPREAPVLTDGRSIGEAVLTKPVE